MLGFSWLLDKTGDRVGIRRKALPRGPENKKSVIGLRGGDYLF